ncbi:hypothetical protein ACP70R_001943 [Stipagrostis hirtigluma subsp. patula]
MASLLVFLLATAFAVGAANAGGYGPGEGERQPEPYPSSCSQTDLPGIIERCKGDNAALFEARDKCCNELGKHSECTCLVLTEIFNSFYPYQVKHLPPLPLCDNYDACQNGDLQRCQPFNREISDDAKNACKKVVNELPNLHHRCLHDLFRLKGTSGICFDWALEKLGIQKYAAVIEKICEGHH